MTTLVRMERLPYVHGPYTSASGPQAQANLCTSSGFTDQAVTGLRLRAFAVVIGSARARRRNPARAATGPSQQAASAHATFIPVANSVFPVEANARYRLSRVMPVSFAYAVSMRSTTCVKKSRDQTSSDALSRTKRSTSWRAWATSRLAMPVCNRCSRAALSNEPSPTQSPD